MSNRYIITRKDGSLEDWGAESVTFGHTHILFLDGAGEIINAVHADEVREIVVEAEG